MIMKLQGKFYHTETYDIVVSMNGFHAFPDKERAFRETWRVLKMVVHLLLVFTLRRSQK